MAKSLDKKKLCKLADGGVGECLAEYVERVSKPRFYCEKCLRVARKKQNLCRPRKLKPA